jgi:hypothetical protein
MPKRLNLLVSIMVAVAPAAVAAPLNQQQEAQLRANTEKEIAARFKNGGRYVIGQESAQQPHQHCTEILAGHDMLTKPPVDAYATLARDPATPVDKPKAKLLECNYPFPGNDPRRGWAIVVAASPGNITDRIVNACKAAAPDDAAACTKKMLLSGFQFPWGSNNFIYPVTGFVREPCSDGENLIGFRHGVTMQYGKSPTDATKMEYCVKNNTAIQVQRAIGLTHTTHEVFKIGRIAAVSRESIAEEGDFSNNKPEGLKPDSFQAYVIENEVTAVKTGVDRLMAIKAAQVMGKPIPPKP